MKIIKGLRVKKMKIPEEYGDRSGELPKDIL